MKFIRYLLQFFFTVLTTFKPNKFHPLVWITGEPYIGKNVHIGAFSEVSCLGSNVTIGDNCDIAAFVSINCADSHKLCLGIKSFVERRDIIIGKNVFIGSHSIIKGGAIIGDFSVIAAGTVVDGVEIPAYSLVFGNPMHVKKEYYKKQLKKNAL